MSSMQRNLARQQRKAQPQAPQGGPPGGGGNPLAALLGGLSELEKLGAMATEFQRMMDNANFLVGELTSAREAMVASMTQLNTVQERLNEVQYELDCQRAVFLRFLTTGSGSVFSSGETAITKFLALEERFRAEYAAMRFFMSCADLASKERP